MEIVLKWLNDDLKLEPKVTDITQEFSNGYRFAEILHILSEISDEEFSEFSKDANDISSKKENFTKIKKYFQKIYSLEIREEEFDDIINLDISKATVILYRLKNSIIKKKIHFSDIETFAEKPNPEEIQKKVQEILDNQYGRDTKYKETNYRYSNGESEYNYSLVSESYPVSKNQFSNNNSIETVSEENIDSENSLTNNKEEKNFWKNKVENNKSMDAYNYLNKKKRKLSPIQSESNIRGTIKNKLKQISMTPMNNRNNKNKILKSAVIYSGEEEKKLKLYPNTQKKMHQKYIKSSDAVYDVNKDEALKMLREELKKKIENKKLEMKQKEEKSKKELYPCIYEVPEIDFCRKDRNIFNERKQAQMDLSTNKKKEPVFNTASRRLKYSKDLKESIYKKKSDKITQKFKIMFEKRTEELNNELEAKNQNSFKNKFKQRKSIMALNIDLSVNKNGFNKDVFFHDVNKIDYKSYDEAIQKKHKKMKNDFPLIKDIMYYILEYAEEISLYLSENDKKLIDVNDYINYSKVFMKKEPFREIIIDEEALALKQVNNEKKDIDINTLSLTSEEEFLVMDYLNIIGEWAPSRICLKAGGNFDIHICNPNLPADYEPTQIEIDDLCLPNSNVDNYLFGDIILEIFDNKYNDNENKNNDKENKWEYIPYKIALIGYPLSGRKLISENLVKKYCNLKVYSCQKILRDYYEHYKNITEPIDVENNPKYKNMKPNQIEQLKTERQKQIEEYQPIINMIQSYIDIMNNDEIKLKIPNDELLLNILINKIETDFPKKSSEDLNKELLEHQTKTSNLLKQIEELKKIKASNPKPNPKDDIAISNAEKELENIKNNSINGFILVDFPTNLNQCNLLEKYLTGYVDDLQKPKTEKNKNIQNLSNIIDFRLHPNENISLKKSGIDFIINIPTNEEEISKRFSNIKYDPQNDKIYTKAEINDAKHPLDKKILERLVNEIPYLTKDIFEFYKKEYIDNIAKVNEFYNKFGKEVELDENNILNIDETNETIKTYQNVDLEEKIEKIDDKNNTTKTQNTDNNKDDINKILDFISTKLIDFLYNEKDKKEKKIYQEQENAKNITENENNNNANENNDRIQMPPEMQVSSKNITSNDITPPKKMSINNTTAPNFGEQRLINSILYNSNCVLEDLNNLDQNYTKNIGLFAHLVFNQRKDIYQRLNLIQKKYSEFLNYQTKKKKLIHIYVTKYNSFFKTHPKLFLSQKAIDEFSKDIEELDKNLWLLLIEKEKESLHEMYTIKSIGFIENELVQFYNNIRNLFILETKKFIKMINSIIDLYKIKNDKPAEIKENDETENHAPVENKNNDFDEDINNILNGEVKVEFKKNSSKDVSKIENIDTSKIDMESTEKMDNIISNIEKNVNLFYENGIIYMFSLIEKTENSIKCMQEALTQHLKKRGKSKKKNLDNTTNSSMLVNLLGSQKGMNTLGDENLFLFSQTEKIRNMFKNEKNKYKYRINLIKTYTQKYIHIIYKTTKNVYENVDGWVIKSVQLQNKAQKEVIEKLRNILDNKKLIDEEKEINCIEMDAFEKKDEEEEIKIKPFGENNNEVKKEDIVYKKININYLIKENYIASNVDDVNIKNYKDDDFIENINDGDFYFDITKFYNLYGTVKKFEIEKGIISKDVLFEVFLKPYVMDKFDINSKKQDNNNENKKLEEDEEEEDKKNKKGKNEIILNGICHALKMLNSKQINNFLELYNVHIEHSESDNNTEYECYLRTNEIFTLLCLVGCNVLTQEEEENILKELNEKIIYEKFLNKNDFMSYNFWFEKNFEYQKEKKEGYILENCGMEIKELLFNIWKDEKGVNIDIKQLINVLKNTKYMTDVEYIKNKKYYEILFDS